MRAAIILLVALLSVTSIRAWWCTGHMVIAQIAWTTLESDVRQSVSEIFHDLSIDGPFPESPDLMQAGCWADDLKSGRLVSMASWHFINQPYTPTSYKPVQNPVQEENVETVIEQLEKTGKEQKHVKWIQTFAIANLVHFFGDIHQPLHATELFTSEFPNGDKGGNLWSVTVDGQDTRLHFVWDAVCWQWTEEMQRPLNQQNRTWIQQTANALMQKYTVSEADKKVFNSTVMAQESFDAAVKYAYPGAPQPGGTVSQQYLDACIPVAERRIVLAGYRLGSELNYIFRRYRHAPGADVARNIITRLDSLAKMMRKK